MKILQAHNYYRIKGGEDIVVHNERELLEKNNNEVIVYRRGNDEIKELSPLTKLSLLWKTTWSQQTYNEISRIIKETKPDICHVHNILPLITPSIYYACFDNKVPVVQTLHNYRLFCTNAMFYRDNHPCEECLNNSAYHSVQYGCYRNSKMETYSVARMIEKHKKKGTWKNKINGFICPTEFIYQKYEVGGFPASKLYLKPHFLLNDPCISYEDEGFFLFAGRLDSIKGFNVLASAAEGLDNISFKAIGKSYEVNDNINSSNIETYSWKPNNELLNYIKKSTAVIFPSLLYESFGMVIIEAFACGKPVIASRLGAMSEIIEDGKTGLLFESGNSGDLKSKIIWAYKNKDRIKEMGLNGRKVFEEKFTAEKNYKILLNIYNEVLA